MKKILLFAVISMFTTVGIMAQNVLKNGDFEEQGAWEVFHVKGADSTITIEFGNTTDTPQYGEDGCMLVTKLDSGVFGINYLAQKIQLVVGKTYKFTGAFKGMADTTGLGTSGYGWWDQMFVWPAVEDKMLNIDSIKANPGIYAGPGGSDFNTAVFNGLTSWGATGNGLDSVFGDLPGYNVYGDNIGRGGIVTGQGDTTVYIVPAALQRTTDILELGEIGETVDYWFIMNIGHWGSTNGVELTTAYDKFVFEPIADTISPDCEITSGVSNDTTASVFTVSFNFKEAVTGFDVSDIVVSNGRVSNFQETALSTIWTATIIPTSVGAVTVDVAADAAADAAGNGNNASEQFSVNCSSTSVLKNGDFEEQGAWEVFHVKGADSTITIEFGNTTDTPQYGEDGCMLVTKLDSGVFGINYLAQKIKLVVGETYKFTGAFKGMADTTGLGTSGYGWWDQMFVWPAVEDKMLNVDSIKANPGIYAGPGGSDFNTAVFNGLTSWGATGNGLDSVFGDLPGYNVYGDNIGRGGIVTGQGDTTVYIVPAALQRTTDILELGEIGEIVEYWFIMNIGHWGSTNGVELTTAYDKFVFEPIADTISPDCEITSDVSNDTTASPFTATFNFKEAVTGFDLSDVVVGNGIVSNLQETALSTIWTATITPTSIGTITVNVAADAAADAAGNGNNAAEQLTINSTSANVLRNGDFEEQGAWDVFHVKGADSTITIEFGNTTDTPQYGEDGCMLVTKLDSGVFGINYLAQKIQLVVGKTYKFTGAFKGMADTTGLGTSGYGWWDQMFVWPAVEDKMLNVDSLKANPGIYAGPGGSDFNTAVFNGLTSWGATGNGLDSVFGDLPGYNVYGDNIGRGGIVTGQGDTTVYIVPAALQRTTDILELGEIGETVDYWFIMNIGHWGSTNGVELTTAYDKFVFEPIADTISPDCEITSDVSNDTTASPFTATFNFKEAVTGFDLSDVVVGNGIASNVQETALSTIWTATITPTSIGTITVNVAADAAADAAGNGNNAAEQLTINSTSANVLRNGDFEEQGAWDVFHVKGADSTITIEFGNTTEAPQYGEDGCMLVTKLDSGAFGIHYLAQKIALVVGETYQFTGAFKGMADTTGLGTSGYGWWDQMFIWPAVEDKMLNVDSIKANPGIYAGPGGSDFNTAVFNGLTSWGATGNGLDSVFGDLPGYNVYGDNIGRGATNNQGDTTVYIVPAALQRTTDILELGEIGETVEYWFIMNIGHWGSTNGVELTTAYDKFVLKGIEDIVSPNVIISSNVSGDIDSAFTVSFNFKEAVTGFDLSDVVVGNGTVSNFQETAISTIWTADITPTSAGAVTVDVAADVAADAAGNGNIEGEQFSVNYIPTGINEEMFDSNILIYPNPSKGIINLRINNNNNNTISLSVVDVTGRKLWQKQITGLQIDEPINLNGVGKGYYFLRISNGKEAATRSIIIE